MIIMQQWSTYFSPSSLSCSLHWGFEHSIAISYHNMNVRDWQAEILHLSTAPILHTQVLYSYYCHHSPYHSKRHSKLQGSSTHTYQLRPQPGPSSTTFCWPAQTDSRTCGSLLSRTYTPGEWEGKKTLLSGLIWEDRGICCTWILRQATTNSNTVDAGFLSTCVYCKISKKLCARILDIISV